jgi:preprotein translocase subunit YajC
MLTLQPAAPKAGSPVAAPAQQTQTSTQQPSGGGQQPPPSMGIFGSPIFLMLLFLPFIFMMWRRNKKETEARSKMKKGDKVVAGGIVGEIMDVDDRFAKVKIAPGVTVQVVAHAMSPLEETKPAAAADKDAKAKDAKAAKNPVESK